MNASTYVAFLRGINVGGNTVISMEDLKKAFAWLGFANIRTILASGNVVFDAVGTDRAVITAKIEQKLKKKFGFEIAVILRTAEEIQTLLAAKPFENAKITPRTKLQVSFLLLNSAQGLKVSERLSGTDFEVFRLTEGEVCSVVEVSPKWGTSDLMRVLEKQFGKGITTRTWNTVERIAAAGLIPIARGGVKYPR
jgi:uncharacterized protein (DUF1697 family)